MISKQTLINELKFLIFTLVLAFFLSYFMFGVVGKTNWVPLFLFICGIGLMSSIYSHYERILIKRWGNGKFKRMLFLLTFLAAPCSVLGGVAMIFVANSIPFGVSLALMGVYAGIAMNLRRKGLSGFFESSSDPSLIVWYWALGMLLCFPVVYLGFTYFTGNTES